MVTLIILFRGHIVSTIENPTVIPREGELINIKGMCEHLREYEDDDWQRIDEVVHTFKAGGRQTIELSLCSPWK